ncbi:hypothetical protein ACFL1E_06860 [Candidatus Omnitrophota bacterium]
MKIIIVALLAPIIIFFVVMLLSLRAKKSRSRISIEGMQQKEKQKPSRRRKKQANNIFFICIVVIISTIMVYAFHNLLSSKMLQEITKDEEDSSRWIDDDSQQPTNQETTHDISIIAPPEQSLGVHTSRDVFEPYTAELTSFEFSQKKYSSGKLEPLSDIPAVVAELSGASAGDLFVNGIYDQITQGKFSQSKKSILSPLTKTPCQSVKININLPFLKNGQSIQLPCYIGGFVVSQFPEDNSFQLEENGKLTALTDIAKGVFPYVIKKCAGQPLISIEPANMKWLNWEFETIPDELRGFLNAVKETSETTRLATVASILNTHFGYQAGLKAIELGNGETWNSLLDRQLRIGNKLLCDCDVLSTFGFIYMKFLGFDPLFLVGYFNSPGNEKVLRVDELHATLLVKTQGRWLIFEPTLFTNNFNAQLLQEKIAFKEPIYKGIATGKRIESPSVYKTASIGNIMEDAGLAYFKPPPEITNTFSTDITISTTGVTLTELIVDLISLDTQISQPTSTVQTTGITKNAEKTMHISIVMYFLSILAIKLFSKVKGYKRIIFPLSKPYFYMYNVLVIVVFGSLFARSTSMHFGLWSSSNSATLLGLCISLLAGGISTISMGRWLLRSSFDDTMQTVTFSTLIDNNRYLFIGMLFGLAAVLYVPSIPVFISFIGMSFILFTVIRKIRYQKTHAKTI